MMVVRYRNQEGQGEGNDLILTNRIHPEDDQIGMEEAKLLWVPINYGHSLTKSQSPSDPQAIKEMKHIPYREAVGSLMYVVIGTWPDIGYAVPYLARFMANPGHAY